MADESIIANLKSEGFKELINDLGLSAKGFTELDKSITEAQKKLATLDKTSQEFKDLTKEINAATIASQAYSESTDTLKKELRDTTNEIGQLEKAIKALDKAGEQNSQTYKDLIKQQDALKKKAGELKDTVGDLNDEIKNSGSDTKNLDKALRAVTTMAAGYQAAQGVMVLFGAENKKFEQTLLKLNAVMAITQSLQQIQTELSKKDSLFTIALAKAKQFYTVTIREATVATQAFYGLISGGLLLGLGLLITYWEDIADALGFATKSTEELADAQEQLNKIREDAKVLQDAELRYLKAKGASQDELLKKEIALAEAELARLETTIKISQFRFIDPNDPNAFEQRKKAQEEATKVEKQFAAQLLDSKSKILELKKALDDYYAKNETKEKPASKIVKDLENENKRVAILRKKSAEERERIEKEEFKAAEERRLLEDKKNLANERARSENESNNIKLRLKANQELQDSLAEQNRQRQLEDEKREQEHAEKVAFILSQIADVANQLGNIATQAIQIRSQNELNALEQKRKKGLISEKEYERQSAQIKTEAAKKQRNAEIAMAFAQVPLAILSAFTSTPGGIIVKGIVAGLAGAFALAQVAILAASPLPQFKQGGQVSKKLGLIKGKSHSEGGVPIEVEGDEYVMPVKETREHLPALEAMHKGKFHELFVPKKNLIQPDIFANIPNTAMIDKPIMFDKDDYSSINKRLDKLADEMWWLSQYTKEGNISRNRGTEKIVKKLENQSKRYV